jgi:hypothetical protein
LTHAQARRIYYEVPAEDTIRDKAPETWWQKYVMNPIVGSNKLTGEWKAHATDKVGDKMMTKYLMLFGTAINLTCTSLQYTFPNCMIINYVARWRKFHT